MFPPIFETAAQSPAVLTALGPAPLRFYLFGEGPQRPELPYAVWQMISGAPANALAGPPDFDLFDTQIDIYAASAADVRAVAAALRSALELAAYITAFNGESHDQPTRTYRYSFTVEWLTPR